MYLVAPAGHVDFDGGREDEKDGDRAGRKAERHVRPQREEEVVAGGGTKRYKSCNKIQ